MSLNVKHSSDAWFQMRRAAFDPINHSFGGYNLIPVAVARDIRQAMQAAGRFVGARDAFFTMAVEVAALA